MIKAPDLKISMGSIGMTLMCLYIFFSYTAQDILINSKFTSYTLYAFLVWGLFYTFMRFKPQGLLLTTYTAWYLLFFLASFITMLYSPEFSPLSGASHLMIVTLCVTYVIQLVVSDKKDFKIFCWCYVLSALALIIILYFTGNLTATASNRLGGEIVGNANAFAALIMVATIYGLWLIVYELKNIIPKIFLIAIVLLNMYALVLSGGRVFFLMPFVFIYILLVLQTNRKGKRQIIKYSLFAVVIVGIAYYLIMNVPHFYDLIGYRMQYLINSITGVGAIDGSASVRIGMRHLAIARWTESPIWGYGFDSFKYYAKITVGSFFYSHCNYTELLYNGGIIYFALYYWIYYKLIKIFISNKGTPIKYRAYAIAVALCMLVFDYGAVSYNLAIIQIMLAMAFRVMTFRDDRKVAVRLENIA